MPPMQGSLPSDRHRAKGVGSDQWVANSYDDFSKHDRVMKEDHHEDAPSVLHDMALDMERI